MLVISYLEQKFERKKIPKFYSQTCLISKEKKKRKLLKLIFDFKHESCLSLVFAICFKDKKRVVSLEFVFVLNQ